MTKTTVPALLLLVVTGLCLLSSCSVPFETRVKNGLIERLTGCYNNSLLLLNYMQADIKGKLENDRMDREKYRLLLKETESKRIAIDFEKTSLELKHELDQRISRYLDCLEALDSRIIEDEKKLFRIEGDLARLQYLDLVNKLNKASDNWTLMEFSDDVYTVSGYGLGFNIDRLVSGEWKYYCYPRSSGYVTSDVVSQQLLERLHLRYAYGPNFLVEKNYLAFSDLQGERSFQQSGAIPRPPIYYIPGQ